NGQIIGTYSDNTFSDSTPVTGVSGPEGRRFLATFPDLPEGVMSLEVLALTPGVVDGTISLNITTRNSLGLPIENYFLGARMTMALNEVTGPRTVCVVGMGALSDFCGR